MTVTRLSYLEKYMTFMNVSTGNIRLIVAMNDTSFVSVGADSHAEATYYSTHNDGVKCPLLSVCLCPLFTVRGGDQNRIE